MLKLLKNMRRKEVLMVLLCTVLVDLIQVDVDPFKATAHYLMVFL